jgi:hypothetical protein
MVLRWALMSALVCVPAYAIDENRGGQDQDPKSLELQIRPAMAQAPGSIRATAVVERRADNRALTIAAECPEYLRRSTVPLDGAAAARKHTIVFESLPACKYEIRATLHRRNGDVVEDVEIAIITR